MDNAKITELGEVALPFRRVATLREVRYESGLRMLRLVLREGRRITQIDLDTTSAAALGAKLVEHAGLPGTQD